MRDSTLKGMCRTEVWYPSTHGHGEARVAFRESWGEHRFSSSWVFWEELPARKVLVTKLHGEPAPQLRYAATDGVAGDIELTTQVPCAGADQRPAGPDAVRRFHAVTAVSCVERMRTYPGHGRWWVRIRRVAVSSVAGLQRYFEQPNAPNLPKGGFCDDVARFVLVPTFVDGDGHWLVPRVPSDNCGEPLPGHGRAAHAVRWHAVSVHRERR